MTPLFTDQSYADSSAIVKERMRQGIAYELRDEGGSVMAPRDRVARLRMSLAGEGLHGPDPKGARRYRQRARAAKRVRRS
jgi:flagellar biosynthesis/type III secretory pathway M-ring protein FliF/YscJ